MALPNARRRRSVVVSTCDVAGLLLPASISDACEGRVPGGVFVSAELNKPGLEWNMCGVTYGEPPTGAVACAPYDEQAWLRNPTLAYFGSMRIGHGDDPTSDIGFYAALHPDVRTLRVHTDRGVDLDVPTLVLEPDATAARYAAFTVPDDTTSVDITLIDDAGNPVTTFDRDLG